MSLLEIVFVCCLHLYLLSTSALSNGQLSIVVTKVNPDQRKSRIYLYTPTDVTLADEGTSFVWLTPESHCNNMTLFIGHCQHSNVFGKILYQLNTV